jgi:hypothetical protein
MLAHVIGISVEKMNEVPPDLLTDIVLAFLKEIDSRSVARMIDEVAEVVRKIHTGSALLGEPGSPQLPKVLNDMIDQIISQTDPATLWKARIALAEMKATVDQQWSETIHNNSEQFRLSLTKAPELFNIRQRTRNWNISQWDMLDDEELGQSLLQHISAYDIQEAAEVLNNYMRIANRLWEYKPEACAELVSQFANGVDLDELAAMAKHVVGGTGGELKPLARSMVPNLVEWACDTLSPEDDEFEDDAARARDALRALLISKEV